MKKNILTVLGLLIGSGVFADFVFDPADFDSLSGKVHRGDLGRSGVFSATGISAVPAQRWKFQTGGAVKSSPVVVNGVAYFGSYDGAVYAVNAASGALIWSNQTGDRVSGSAAVVSNTVFIISENRKLFAFDATTGATNWSVTVDSNKRPAGSPAVAYGTVFIGAGAQYGDEALSMTGGSIYGYDMQTGEQVWKSASAGPQGRAAIAMDSNTLYAGIGGSTYGAFNLATASTNWNKSQGHQNRQFYSMTVVDGAVYAPGAIRGSVTRYVPSSGSSTWMNTTLDHNSTYEMNMGGLFGSEIFTDVAVAHGRVYAGCNDGKLYTFSQTNGAKGWTFQAGDKIQSSPAVAGDLVYFGSWDGKVYAVNATNGSEAWSYDLGERTVSSPWPAGNTLYIGCDDGALYCLESQADADEDGLPDWWETLYFGNATSAVPAAIAANQRNTLLECYQQNLDPTDPLAGRETAAPVTLSLSTNIVVQDVKRVGLNFTDNYYQSPSLKVRDSRNFEGTVYRQAARGILTTNSLISYFGNSNLLTSGGWTGLYTEPGTVFEVISGPGKGTTGAISSVTFQWHDVWNNGGSNLVPVFAFDRTIDLGTNSSIRDMAIRIENLTRASEGWIGETNSDWGRGDITPVSDNPPGVFGVSCARMDGTSSEAQMKFATLYQTLGEVTGNWTFHFWMKTGSGSPVINIKTVSDTAKFSTNLTPSASWQKVELTIPVVGGSQNHPRFQLSVNGGAALIDQIETWKNSDTNPTAFRDDFVNAMRELNVGVLRQVYMSGNTVSNWIYDPVDRQAGLFRMDGTVGPYGTSRNDPPVGFHSLMGLCEELDAEPWLCLPGAIHPDEVAFFMDYLSGTTNTPGGKIRAALGHPVPWTDTLRAIHLEFGNEAWNSLAWYNFAGFNGADYWRDLIAAGKGSSSYNSKIKFHAAGQNFSSSMTDRILNNATNADHYAIATYMVHSVKASDNWIFDRGDYEAQFKWFLAFPMYKVNDDGMPQQMAALSNAAASAEFSQYEFNYHAADFDTADPGYTNIMNDVNVFLPSIGHGISVVNTMLAEIEKYSMRTQCFFRDTGIDSYDGGRLFGLMHNYKQGSERYRPAFYALSMANRALKGNLVQSSFSGNEPFSAYGVFDDDPETRTYDTLYSYAFRDGSTNALVLINYDLEKIRPVIVDLPDYVKDSTAVQQKLFTPVYTNHNEPESASAMVLPTETNIPFGSGTEIDVPPFSMVLLQWESAGALPHLTASTHALVVPEASTAQFTVRLSSQPAAAVTVAVERISGDTDISVQSGSSLIFTTGDWNQEQAVTLAAADDTDYDLGTALIRISSPGLTPVNVTATEQENDTSEKYLLPFTETFDPGGDPMASTPGSLNGQHGWAVEGGGTATVQSAEVFAGTQAAALSKATALHSFSNGTDTVNVTFYAKPSAAAPPLTMESSGWSAVFYINSNLHAVAYSNQIPVEIASTTASNGWNRFDVRCDYSRQTWSLKLNGTSLFTNFAFYSARPQFSQIAFRDFTGSTTSYVDSISISSDADQGDTDRDGLPDTWEQQYFGDLDSNPGDMAANGINTVMECYIAYLDPTDPDAKFQISDLRFLTSQSVLQWQNASGRVYTIYWSSNLLSGFELLQSGFTGGVFTDAVHGANNQGFYKIEAELE